MTFVPEGTTALPSAVPAPEGMEVLVLVSPDTIAAKPESAGSIRSSRRMPRPTSTVPVRRGGKLSSARNATAKISPEEALKYALERFKLHSGNRLKAFTLYLTIMTLSFSALVGSFGGGKVLGVNLTNLAGIFLGLFQLVMTFVFFMLDYRYSNLTWDDANALIEAEKRMPEGMRPATDGRAKSDEQERIEMDMRNSFNKRWKMYFSKRYWKLVLSKDYWTLGKVLRSVFKMMGTTGALGSLASLLLLVI